MCHKCDSSSSSSSDKKRHHRCSHKKDDCYDYVIVGAGTAGAALAAKLSDPDPNTGHYKRSVLVIEAGQDLSKDPQVLKTNFFDSQHQNFYFDPRWSKTLVAFNFGDTPENSYSTYATTDGRMWGGSSGHNGLQAYRPTPNICDKWVALSGNSRWSYTNLLNNDMIPMEHYTPNGNVANPAQRGSNGPNFITQEPPVKNEQYYQALAAFTAAPLKDDINDMSGPLSTREVGTGSNQDWITPSVNPAPWGGTGAYRSYCGNAYLTGEPSQGIPAIVDSNGNGLNGRKLKVLSFAYANKVLFDGNVAKSVSYQLTKNNHTETKIAKAKKKVILCSGAFYDAAILQRSGVGDPALLTPLGIPIVYPNTNVGRHMLNHNGIYCGFVAPSVTAAITTVSGDGTTLTFKAVNTFSAGQTVVVTGVTPDIYNLIAIITSASGTQFTVASSVTGAPGSGGTAAVSITNTAVDQFAYGNSFIDTKAPYGVGDGSTRKFQLLSFSNGQFGAPPGNQWIGGYYVTPKSEGNIQIQTPEPNANPFVTFNFFSDGDETVVGSDLYESVAFLKEMKAFTNSIDAFMYFPGPAEFESDAKLAAYAKANLSETFHNACSCRMSVTPATGVIDGNLHVHGVENLMVASTASLPVIPNCNTAYSARLVGLEAARIIKGL